MMNRKQQSLHRRALELFNAGRLDESLEAYKKLCRHDDGDAQAWHMTGAIAGMRGEYRLAGTCYEKVIALHPNNPAPYINLANVLAATGRVPDAVQQLEHALRLKPGDAQALTNLANLHVQQGQPQRAMEYLQEAIRANSAYPEAYNSLGNIHRLLSQHETAVACFRKALAIKPDHIDALCNLGAALSDTLCFSDAQACYKRALEYAPGHPGALRNLGDLYQSSGDFDKARDCYQRVLQQAPNDIHTRVSLAKLHERCGDNDRALALLEPLIQSRVLDADAVITYATLCRKQGRTEEALQILSQALEQPANQAKRVDLHFALGELHDRAGQYELAFEQFRTANDMDDATQTAQNRTADFEPLARFYSKARIGELPRSSILSELPVFIVGMPRTGTSLVEQILASHPLVSAGGERGDIFAVADTLRTDADRDRQIPAALETLSQDRLKELATTYLEQIKALSHGCTRFTDKTPLHGIQAGFISQLLPASRLIICHRNPLDACLSIYFHRFNAFHGYARRLDELGAFYREYYRLMAHWSDTLDLKILNVRYEDLVSAPETQIRAIVDFCGLDWDDNCLSFHENRRTVNTPSYDQVRKPIYTDAIARWSNYDRHLAPLRCALET
jgi:tetratricopeptide (TPR) repeat protein